MRLFTAFNFPQHVRARWIAETAALRAVAESARWVGPEQMHLTVTFMGEQPETVVEPLTVALDEIARGYAPQALEIGGVGAFPSWRRARVLWLGVKPTPSLMALAAEVGQAGTRLGGTTEERPFRPHITLARLDGRASTLRGLERAAQTIGDSTVAYVSSIDLMASSVVRGRARHDVLYRAQLSREG